MRNSRCLTAAALIGSVLFSAGTAGAIEVLDAGYVVEHYVTFDCANARPVTDMAFDPSGNLYVTHTREVSGVNGTIYRIDTERNVIPWVTGLTRPLDIIWGGGTGYGDYLYVLEGNGNQYWDKGGVRRVGLDGTMSKFSGSGGNLPGVIGVDKTGNYGGLMYMGNTAWDKILKVMIDGQVQSFSGFPYNLSGAPSSIVFDESGNYGGLMYVGTFSTNTPKWSGLFTLDATGDPTRFAPEITMVASMVFDTSVEQRFGGQLYVIGKTGDDPKWALYRVYPDGQIEKLTVSTYQDQKITFGPDGYLYMVESNWGDVVATVSRIIPRNPLLVPLEKAIALKEEALEKVESALIEERALLAALDELPNIGDPCELGPVDLFRIKLNIALSILQERATIHHLNKSIERLQDGWKILAGEDDYDNLWRKRQGQKSDLEKADLNGDEIVDTRDFAIMSRYWLRTYKK
ncbi:MAG: hypothetical protein GY869_11705 [Planctomycetes bacterium]|nr:hypothetical protein [Planctomycetota bacterium]